MSCALFGTLRVSGEGSTLRRSATSDTDPISRIDRLADPDAQLAPDDVAVLRAALRLALAGGDTIESAFGLATGWQRHIHQRRATAALASVTPTGRSDRAQAEQIRSAAQRYKASAQYEIDLARGAPADPADAISFAVLRAHGGRVASFSTILRLRRLTQNRR
jgi:hypothetical protein